MNIASRSDTPSGNPDSYQNEEIIITDKSVGIEVLAMIVPSLRGELLVSG